MHKLTEKIHLPIHKNKILTVTTGATIFQKNVNGKMEIATSVKDIAKQIKFEGQLDFFEIGKRSGSEMVFETIIALRDKIISEASNYDGFVILTGTDCMEEIAFSLDLLIDIENPVVISGSMKPSDIIGYDGIANYSDAIKIAASNEARNKGILLFLNDTIHLARYVRKTDSALMGSFKSHPGSIGEVRCDKVIFYYDVLNKTETYENLDLDKLYSLNVPIWTMTISPYFPTEMLPNIDGLVIAGMGTGSLSNNLIDKLSTGWTNKIPIILSSRCNIGFSYDDNYYKGSKEKYEQKGFLIEDYFILNPLQARIRLCFELSNKS
jgi:L-asparaginase